MESKKQFNIISEPKNKIYHDIIDKSLIFGDKFLLVEREFNISKNFTININSLNKYLIKKEKVKSWPGTKLLNPVEFGILNFYMLNSESIQLLKNLTNGLFSWQYPDFPEDLIFVRKNKTPWLISISHEKDAYFELTNEEMKLLSSMISGLDRLIQVENQFDE